MNKAQLIDAIAEKAGLTKADSKKALEAFVETVGDALKSSAHFSPSIAAETIPPAYPAPSPQGYKPPTSTWTKKLS